MRGKAKPQDAPPKASKSQEHFPPSSATPEDLLLDTKVAEVDSSAVFSQETALHLAAKAGHQDVVTKLLLRGAPLDAEDRLLRRSDIVKSGGSPPCTKGIRSWFMDVYG